jgi:peptidoglycan/LPS O-acetylase OafA/YrhL
MVISGFCLFWPLCKSTEALGSWDWRVYTRRRVRRIIPPYYAAIGYTILLPIILVAAYRALKLPAHWQPIPSAWQLFTHFLFIHSLFPGTWNGITGAYWSLGLEAQFYALFPLVVFGFRRAGVQAIWLIIIASVLFRTLIGLSGLPPAWEYILSISFLGRWMEFGAGMLTALAVAKYWRQGRANSALAGTAQIGGALALYIMAVAAPSFAYVPIEEVLLSGAFGLLIFALCTSRTPLAKAFRNPLLDWLGVISYSFYLLHQPTAWYFSEFLKKDLHLSGAADFCLLSTVGILIVVAVAWPYFLIFEKPGLSMNQSKKPPDAAPAAPVKEQPVEDPSWADASSAQIPVPGRR